MAIDILKTVDIIEVMENHIEKIRPPKEIRDKLDLGYSIENQSVILTEIRPIFRRPTEYAENGYAKATYVKSKNIWKIYWLRANGKWDAYEEAHEVKTLQEFLDIVDEDKFYCFKG